MSSKVLSTFTDAAGGAITVGLHIDDYNKGMFLEQAVAEPQHGVDSNGGYFLGRNWYVVVIVVIALTRKR